MAAKKLAVAAKKLAGAAKIYSICIINYTKKIALAANAFINIAGAININSHRNLFSSY